MAVFDEPLLGQSALDRFCHRAHQFVIEGDSYRQRAAPGVTPSAQQVRKPPPEREPKCPEGTSLRARPE